MENNRNDNHAVVRSNQSDKSNTTANSIVNNNSKVVKKCVMKSKVVKIPDEVHSEEFEENGEILQMEVHDGSEFASKNEDSEVASDHETNSENDSDESEHEMQTGEIPSESEHEASVSDDETRSIKTPVLPSPGKCKKKKSKRQSIEEMEVRLNTMSSTLQTIKELLLQKEQTPESRQNKATQQGKNVVLTEIFASDTTIYRNVLEKADDQQDDPEITFKLNEEQKTNVSAPNKRDSSSSEDQDQVNTSDELMDTDMDINDKFIADCACEAKRHKLPSSLDREQIITDQPGMKERADTVI